MLRSLYNTEISERRCVGYCWKHKVAVTATQVKHKECLKKQCDALEKYEHEYWRQRELTKQRRKERRKCQ